MTERSKDVQPLFLPRPHEKVDGYIDELSRDPSEALQPDEKAEVYDFERTLFEAGSYGEIVNPCEADGQPVSLEKLDLLDNGTALIAPAYFLTDAGRQAAKEAKLDDLSQAPDEPAIIDCLMEYSFTDSAKITKKIISKSTKWFDNQFKEALLSGIDPGHIALINFIHNPSEYALYVRGLMGYSILLRTIKTQLKNEPGIVADAKTAVVELYQAKINDYLAKEYPVTLNMYGQLGPSRQAEFALNLGADRQMRMKHILSIQRTNKRFLQRLDALRSGLSCDIRITGLRSIGQKMLDFIESPNATEPVFNKPVFSSDEVEKLSRLEIKAEEMKDLLESALAERGILSEYKYDTESDRTRGTRAADNKWQVVVDATRKSLFVSSKAGVVKVPESFARSPVSIAPSGAIPVAAQTLEHVEQAERVFQNPQSLRLIKGRGGKRSVMYTAIGGLMAERKAHVELFGQEKPYRRTYPLIMRSYEQTGSEFAAMQAFYEYSVAEAGTGISDVERQTIAGRAVSATRRITRRKGGFDSQALNYAESGLLEQSLSQLSPEVQDMIYGQAAFDLPDLVRLHRYGLYDPGTRPEQTLPELFMLQATEYLKSKFKS